MPMPAPRATAEGYLGMEHTPRNSTTAPEREGVALEVERIWSDRIQKTQDLQCFQRALCHRTAVSDRCNRLLVVYRV